MGELDDKPKEYFETTKKEVSHKNALAKWVHQHKMQNVDTSDDERKVDQEYQNFKENKTEFPPFVTRKYKNSKSKITCP